MLVGMLARWRERFRCAGRGFLETLEREPCMRVHVVAGVLVVVAGLVLRVSAVEWAVLVLAMGLVVTAEVLNTVVERLADRVSGEREEAIRVVKDAAAGAVLVAAVAAVGVGLVVFGPKLWALRWWG
jgi:diacylglycerol kinase (ATP)